MSDPGELFPEVDPEAIRAARRSFSLVEVGRGVTLIEQGERDAAILFITEGHVAVRSGGFEIATLGPGGVVGEIGLFRGAHRIADVRAVTPCVFWVLERAAYRALLDAKNPVAYAIERRALSQLVTRLRDADERISTLAAGSALPISRETNGVVRAVEFDAAGALERSRLFADAPLAALVEIARHTEAREFLPGEALCRQGERGDDLFLLAEGRVEVLVEAPDGKAEVVAALEPGDAFGMASVLQDRPRMASCVAQTRVLALRVARAEALALSDADTPAGSVLRTAMLRALADQITYANAQFAQLSLARKRRTAELLARLGIEAHGGHLRAEVIHHAKRDDDPDILDASDLEVIED